MPKTTNFHFLSSWQRLFSLVQTAEQKVFTEPRTSLMYARLALETAINWMYNHDEELEKPQETSLSGLMFEPSFKEQINEKLYRELHLIRKLGNFAAHGKKVSERDALTSIDHLYYFCRWFAKSYHEEDLGDLGIFDWDLIPRGTSEDLSKKRIKALEAQLEKQQKAFQKLQDEELIRQQELIEENELYRRQQEALQQQINLNKERANQADQTTHPRDEKETRRLLIDVALREAGWDIERADVREYKVDGLPKSTNPSGTGYIDYVLWDDDGMPLAVVEAKRSMVNARQGENQAQLYAEALEKKFGRRPVMFYSNGFETYLWDDLFYKVARKVNGFYTQSELQTLMFRRKNRNDIRKIEIDADIAGRTYQMRAIKSIAEHFTGNDKRSERLIGTNRRALLVMATGTGKTRTAIAFSKLLLEANWAKRILFLADRISLVKQAKRNFAKLLPEHTTVNLIEDKENPDARIVFSSYQTMMNLIDENLDDSGRFYGVGHFDLVIIDEAHRSIYQKYQAIFEYFDALLLGLTATPKNSIHHNTYEVFDLPDKTPTDAYTFDEAVRDKYIKPYHSIALPTKFLLQGIKYSDLSEEEKRKFEIQILNGEPATGTEFIPKEMLDKFLFNEDTARKILTFVLENGIKKQGGDELGKTIIFARSQEHAHFLKDVFIKLDKELFGNDYVKVITHNEPKSQEFIERFCDEEKDRLPQIAISVDMMDTGIDAPSVVNLVFYKPVYSYTKFWQMIGRGSRLRPNLFGPGQDKTHFLIFDVLNNFEFFEENPNGVEPNPSKSITRIILELKLQLAEYLKENQFENHPDLQNFRVNLLDDLHKEVCLLDENRFEVRMNLKTVLDYGNQKRKVWNHLKPKDLHSIEDVLFPLIRPKKGDHPLARFYDRLFYSLMIERLETPENAIFIARFAISIFKVRELSQNLLRKLSIPAIKKKEDLIKEPLQESFWKLEGIDHLERIRHGLRDLIKFIDKEKETHLNTDILDELGEIKISKPFEGAEVSGEPENVYPTIFKNNLHRLEKLIRENKDHLTIHRIRNGESITAEELKALEKILFNESLNKEEIEEELGEKLNLTQMIIQLMGLSKEKVNQAFADFINKNQLSSVQISFLETIKEFLTKNGQIDPVKLYESPFIRYDNLGIAGVFNDEQRTKIFAIIKDFNELNKRA